MGLPGQVLCAVFLCSIDTVVAIKGQLLKSVYVQSPSLGINNIPCEIYMGTSSR